jgi:hypothetical protein
MAKAIVAIRRLAVSLGKVRNRTTSSLFAARTRGVPRVTDGVAFRTALSFFVETQIAHGFVCPDMGRPSDVRPPIVRDGGNGVADQTQTIVQQFGSFVPTNNGSLHVQQLRKMPK